VLACGGALVVAAALAAVTFATGRGSGSFASPPPPVVTPVPTAPAATPWDLVPGAVPTRVVISTLGVDAAVVTYTVEQAQKATDTLTGEPCYRDGVITCINPPTAADVYWQQGGIAGVAYGAMAGTDAQSNIYLVAHAGEPSMRAVFSDLYQLSAGDVVDVATVNGTLTYTVTDVITVDKGAYTSVPEVTTQVPGRLLLVTCNHAPGADLRGGISLQNVVVVAQLEGAREAS